MDNVEALVQAADLTDACLGEVSCQAIVKRAEAEGIVARTYGPLAIRAAGICATCPRISEQDGKVNLVPERW